MSTATESIVKRLVVLATVAGLGSGIAFMLVACGGRASAPSVRPHAAAWRILPKAPVEIDASLDSVWTGKEVIISSVRFGPSGNFLGSRNVAAAYNPATRAWRRLSPAPKMDNYCRRDVAWTGTEVVLWGCGQAALDPQTDTWRTLPKPPTGQGIVVWTGREMIGWGGGCCGDAWSAGSAYDPAANTWRTLARTPLAPSQGALGAWTGHEVVLLVSGIDPASGKPYPARFARAAAYDPANDTWRRIAPLPEHGLRSGGAAVWDGHQVLVVGAGEDARATLAYNPATNRWRRLASLPSARVDVKAVWTGKRVLVWGSSSDVAASTSPAGLAYDPTTDRWSSLPQAPLLGNGQTVAWTGRQLIVWGGVIGTPVGTAHPEEYPKYLTDGAAYTPAPERSAR